MLHCKSPLLSVLDLTLEYVKTMSFQYLVNRPSINWLKDVPQDDMFAEEPNSSTGEKTSRSSCANIK
jgi:hypothetical protein